jgi:RNA recognition motif-containing protein
MASKSLFVGNVPHGTTSEELRELFAAYEPADVRMIGDKGFGFVDVPEEKAAEAISTMSGKDFKGRPLTVNEARPRGDRPRGGGGGYGGGGGRGGGGYGGGGGRGGGGGGYGGGGGGSRRW